MARTARVVAFLRHRRAILQRVRRRTSIYGPGKRVQHGGTAVLPRPGFSADVDYRRFIHRLGHEPIGGPRAGPALSAEGGFYNPPLASTRRATRCLGEDFNPGEDYALRVQQLDANFGGNLTQNLRWKLNVWGMKKEGTRQANSRRLTVSATAQGTGSTCHVVSKRSKSTG